LIKKPSGDYVIYLIAMPYKKYSVQKIRVLNGTSRYKIEEEVILTNQNMDTKAKSAFHYMAIKTRREL